MVAVQRDTLPAISPAHVTDTHEERCRKAIGRADFYAEQGGLATKTHRPYAEFIGSVEDVLLEFIEFGNRIAVLEPAQKLLFGEFVAGGAVAADAHAQDTGAAAFA